MGAEDEYEPGQDHLAERLAEIDDTLADQRAEALRASLGDYELEDEDAALLTDELPPAAYTDPGFAQFLKREASTR